MRKNRIIIWAATGLFSAFGLLLSGCGKKENPVPPEADTTPPRVIFAYPADSSSGLPRNSVIYVYFSEPMDQSSAQGAFSCGVAGSFFWFGNVMLFVPGAAFPANDTVRISISSAAQDKAGNGLSPAFGHWFATGADIDDVRPTVVALSPTAGASGVAVGGNITMRTSEPVLQFITGQVRLTDSLGNIVSGNTSWQDSVTVVFNPSADLASNMRYTVTVDTILRDRCWNRNEPASWQFTTEEDNTPPTVVSCSPADGATNVSLKDSLMITFSEPMDTASVRAAFAIVPAIAGTISWNGLTVLKFKPSQILSVKRTYSVTVGTGARDRNGNQMAAPFNLSFTTDRVVYAASISAGKVYVMSRSSGQEMQQIAIANPVGLACSQDGTKLYVLTGGAAGSLKVLDPANAHQELRQIAIGNYPYAMDVLNQLILISCHTGNSVKLVDTTAWGSPANYAVDAGPYGVGIGNNQLFVACASAAKLSAYTYSGVFQQNVNILASSKMLAMSPSRDTVYLCEGTQISAFLAASLAWLGSADTYCEDAVRAGNYLYVTDPSNPRVRVYAPNNINHIQDITIGAAAKDLCASADGSRVYSANGSAGTVSEINTTTNAVVRTLSIGAAVDAVAVSP